MTDQNDKSPHNPGTEEEQLRPFLLTAFCLFGFTFYGFISLLFFLALIFSGNIAAVVIKYSPEQANHRFSVFLFIIGGFLAHAIAFFGIIQIWRLRQSGFLIFGIAALIISAYQVFQPQISVIPVALNVSLIILFGLFYRKGRRR